MNTIKDLAKKYWNELDLKTQNYLLIQYNIVAKNTPYWDAVENIFYNEVIVKWFFNQDELPKEPLSIAEIKQAYLKEHSKEEPMKNIFLQHH